MLKNITGPKPLKTPWTFYKNKPNLQSHLYKLVFFISTHMRIGIDARMYGKAQTGIGNYIKQLTAELFQLDNINDYYIFLLNDGYEQFNCPANNVHKIKVSQPWYSYAEQTGFLRVLLKYKLDLVHFPHFNAPIFYNRPRLHTIHDITPHFFPGHKQKSIWRKFAYELTLKTALKKSPKIIASSQSTKNDLINYFSLKADKIEVVYLGLESEFKIITDYDKIKAVQAKYKITKPFLFFVSAWRNHKNFEGLIKAFEILKTQDNLDYQLVLGGQEDQHYLNISQAIKNSPCRNDIITTGFIPDQDLPLLYNAADIFVIPSFYEGFGLIGLEAMACGTAVVSSEVTSLPEIMGKAGLYFNPQDSAEMARIIKQVITNSELKQALIAKGLIQIQKYSWKECAKKTLRLYHQIINI